MTNLTYILSNILAAQNLPVFQSVRILQILFKVMQSLVDVAQAQVIILRPEYECPNKRRPSKNNNNYSRN